MSKNDVITLNARIDRSHAERAPELEDSEFFELLAAQQVLKDFEPSDDELEQGRVDGENDGGLDGLYFLINRQFVTADTEDVDPKTVQRVDLVLIQATQETGFNEKRVAKLNLLTEDLLDLGTVGLPRGVYNTDLLSKMTRFKDCYRVLLGVQHQINISYYYVSKGDRVNINKALNAQHERVKSESSRAF